MRCFMSFVLVLVGLSALLTPANAEKRVALVIGNNQYVKGDWFPSLIDECLALQPNVIAVTTTPAADLLKRATRTVPIVMVALGDPLGTSLVSSLSRPSENITGMSLTS